MINKYVYPERNYWPALIQRAQSLSSVELRETVANILCNVKSERDLALRDFNCKFDNFKSPRYQLNTEEIAKGAALASEELKSAINLAANNIKKFHFKNISARRAVKIAQGLICEEHTLAIETVGLYVPGGSAPLISTLLMCAIPARLAGCENIIVCTPALRNVATEAANQDADLSQFVNPGLLYICQMLELQSVNLLGGAQAIAAMAYGTESIPACDKIFGPGNSYVTEAKKQVSMEGISIDMPAGPSELLIIADRQARLDFIVADTLAQAEHGPDSQVLILTDCQKIFDNFEAELQKQLATLPRADIAAKAITNSKLVLLNDLAQAIALSNLYAPEHLILAVEQARELSKQVRNAGSVFLGNCTPEALGDYASGTNHVLPTSAYSKSVSGLTVESFQKKIFLQELTASTNIELAKAVSLLAETEGLSGHARSMRLRYPEVEF